MTVTDDLRPPIPATLQHRPLTGGLVIPWVNVQLADGGVDFRARHESRLQRCWRDQMCQVCSTGIRSSLIALTGGPVALESLQFDEPPMHPECAVYASKACPMLAGRLLRFASHVAPVDTRRGKSCPTPGCECGGWVPSSNDRHSTDGGAPAHPWYVFYVDGYSLGVLDGFPDAVHCGVVERSQVRVVRQIASPGGPRVWARVDLPDPPK